MLKWWDRISGAEQRIKERMITAMTHEWMTHSYCGDVLEFIENMKSKELE